MEEKKETAEEKPSGLLSPDVAKEIQGYMTAEANDLSGKGRWYAKLNGKYTVTNSPQAFVLAMITVLSQDKGVCLMAVRHDRKERTLSVVYGRREGNVTTFVGNLTIMGEKAGMIAMAEESLGKCLKAMKEAKK